MRLFRPMLAKHDLTEQQWRVLRALSASPEPLEVAAIADATFLLGPSLSRILSKLEDRTLVNRTPVAEDQRRAAICLTSAGQAVVDQVAPHSEQIYDQIEDAFGSTDLQQLIVALNQLRDTLTPRSTT